MKYSELCKVYEELEKTSKRLEKTEILSNFLKEIKHEKHREIIYLLKGRLFPDYDQREIGISEQLAIKALSKATGSNEDSIVKSWKKIGDLGLVAFEICKNKKQSTLWKKDLTTEKVLENLQKLTTLEGKGTVDKKLGLIAELIGMASPVEAKYLVRTLLSDLRIGLGDGVLRDAIVWSCLDKENKEDFVLVQEAYDKSTDFGLVFAQACRGRKELEETELSPGKPVKVMLAQKADSIEDGFERVGKPAVFEYKYDGFRMLINKDENGVIKIFTRRLENVSLQFPEVKGYVEKYVNAKTFIIDCEAVGFNSDTKKYTRFQDISQRIKRKYDIEKVAKELPVELNIFDILYYNGKSLINSPFGERRAILEKIVRGKKWQLSLSEQLITDNIEKAQKFYEQALEEGEEGVMIKNLSAPYKPGSRVGFMLKLKPTSNEYDLVITGAEYGTGKRGGWLTSFDVSCRDDGNFLEIGKVSTGLKELEEEGVSFKEMTERLKNLIIKSDGKHVSVKPEIVITVTYQDLQKSPTYSSGFALRFPRFTALRLDRNTTDIASIDDIKKDYRKSEK